MSVFELSGRKALVTGGAQGLGEGMAQALAAAGATVVIADLQEDARRAVAESPRARAHGFVAPRRHRRRRLGARRSARPSSTLGGLDILVNNAGIEITSLFIDLTRPTCARCSRSTSSAPRSASSTASAPCAPAAPAGNGGAIINIASVAATIAFPGIADLLRHQVRASTG